MADSDIIDGIGPRLRALRERRGLTLAVLSRATGISTSTLSRLESGGRKATLELLLPLARVHQVALDEITGMSAPEDPRVRPEAITSHGRVLYPLTRTPGVLQAYKMVVPGNEPEGSLQTHDGYGWMYVLSGRMRLRLGPLSYLLHAGEVAEFDTRTPHAFGNAGARPAELLVMFGPQGERMHVRARGRRRTAG